MQFVLTLYERETLPTAYARCISVVAHAQLRHSVGPPRVLEYSLFSISGCKFPFPVAVFAVN